jgi:hypothetical protein
MGAGQLDFAGEIELNPQGADGVRLRLILRFWPNTTVMHFHGAMHE